MNPSALLNAYLYTVLKQNYASMPYLSMPMLGQHVMPTNGIGSCSAHDVALPAATAQPIVQPLPERSSAYHTPSAQPSLPSPAPPSIKTRVAVTPEITKILRDWFEAHVDYPYPDDATKKLLMAKTCLTRTQVNNWFTNRRRSYEQQNGHVKWIKMAAPACAKTKRSAAQRDAVEPAKKKARVSTD